MHQHKQASRVGRFGAALLLGAAGFAVAALVGVAFAKSFTLEVASGTVTNQKMMTSHESIATNSHGMALYLLTGDSRQHPECTKANSCLKFWFPLTVGSGHAATKMPGIKGKLGTWKRNGFTQVTLNGHPLYTFSLDSKKRTAIGEGIQSFGGTWHVIRPSGTSTKGTTQTTTSSTTTSSGTTSSGTTTTSTTAMPCLYPPCY